MNPRSALAVAILIVACLRVTGAQAAGYLQPEWSVGQDQVSPELLAVTPPPAAPAELTVEEAVATALQRNIGFRRTIQGLLANRSALSVALRRWQLELTGSVTRTSNGETTTDKQLGASLDYSAVTGAQISVSAELDRLDSEEKLDTVNASLRQPLLAGAGRASAAYEEVRLARNVYRAALLSYFVDRQDLIISVLSAYFNAVEQTQLAEIQASSVHLAEQAVRDAQLRLEAGLIAEIDVTRAQFRLARAQTDQVLQRQSEQDALDELLFLLGYEVGGKPKLVTTITYSLAPVDMDTAVSQALQRRPEVRLADLTIENRDAALRINRSSSLPTLDLVAAIQRTSNELTQRSRSIGLEASVPVASRALTEAVRQAYWSLLVARQERENIRQQVALEVRSQARAAGAAQANVDINTKNLEVAQRSLQIAGRMVEEGLATNRDLLDAQDELTRSGISLVTSRINYYLSTVRLRRSMGADVGVDLPTGRVEAPAAPGPGAGGGGV